MTKLFKYLKRSVLPILAVIVLLVIQAFCDLSLPENISNIVNIGIQQGGVEHIAPQEIRESQMNRLFYFMDEKDKEAVLSRYSLENSDKKEGLKVYVLNDGIKSADIEELEEIFGVPMLVVSFLESDNKQVKEMTAQMTQAMPAGMVPENATILDVLDQMPEEQRNQMLKSLKGRRRNTRISIRALSSRWRFPLYRRNTKKPVSIPTSCKTIISGTRGSGCSRIHLLS